MPPKKKRPGTAAAPKKPAKKKARKQLAKKKPSPTPSSSSSSSEDDEAPTSRFAGGDSSDSDDGEWRNASAAACRKRWGASCPYNDVGFDLGEQHEYNDEEDQIVEDHQFSDGTLNPVPAEWKCPSTGVNTVKYTPPERLARWRTVSKQQSVVTSWAKFVKEDDEYRYEYNPAEAIGYAEGGFTVDVDSIIRALAGQDTKKRKKQDNYFSYTGYVDACSASFDVKIIEGSHADIKRANIGSGEYASTEGLDESMIFEVRVCEASMEIGTWEDELGGMVRHLKSVSRR